MILDRDAFTIVYDASRVTLEDMVEAIRSLGYTPRLATPGTTSVDADPASNATGEIPEPIRSALQSAAAAQKYLFVKFTAPWCIACKALEQTTLDNAAVQSVLEQFLVLEVDTDTSPLSAAWYGVVGMPTLLVLDWQGVEMFRSVGPIAAATLASVLNDLAQPMQ